MKHRLTKPTDFYPPSAFAVCDETNWPHDIWILEDVVFENGLFPLGPIIVTRRAAHAFKRAAMLASSPDELDSVSVDSFLKRHNTGDWGQVSEVERQENELSLKNDFSVYSSYYLPLERAAFRIITEGDRSGTIVVLRDEY